MKPFCYYPFLMSQTLLNPEQSARVIGVTRPGFVKMHKRGDIKAEITAGRQVFFTVKAVKALKKKRDRAKVRVK